MDKITIIIADDHDLFADGLRLLLSVNKNIEILKIVSDGKELLQILHNIKPDIILLDINMPKLNGLEAAAKIKVYYPSQKIIILSTYNDWHLIQKAMEMSIDSYLIKTADKKELFNCIDEVMLGNKYFPDIHPNLEPNIFDKEDSLIKKYNLTKREFEILQLIKQTLTNHQISEKLFISIYTVETHRKNIMHKLNINSPVGLMKFINENNM